MKPTWQPAGISFSLRLLTLVLVPLVGLAFLGFQRIDDERSAADEARSLVEDARLQQDVAAVYGPAQLEQIALEGLAAIDAIDVPRELVVTIAGVDFESTYDDNAVEFEAALDRLAANHGDFVPSGGATLSDRLSFIRGELATQRRLSSQARAEPADVRSVFADLDELLADAVRSTRSFQIDGATSSSTNDRIALAALSEVLVRAAQAQVAASDPWVALCPVDGITLEPSGGYVHFDSQGYVDLGYRLFQTLQPMLR